MSEKKITHEINEAAALNDDQLNNISGGGRESLIRPKAMHNNHFCEKCLATFSTEEEYLKHVETCFVR